MAILRGGIRIGGYDIRIGLPRDTSLDSVESDPRIFRQPGGNPASVMGRFQSYINEAEGFSRKARFYVEFRLPRSSGSTASQQTAPNVLNDSSGSTEYGQPPAIINDLNLSTSDVESITTFYDQSAMLDVQNSNGRRVNAFCRAISMPERDIQLKEVRQNSGPAYKIAFDRKSADITATFMTDKFLRERSYFELWQSAVFSQDSNNYNFYDNYVSDINIYQLGQFASADERDDITYGVRLFDCVPKTISAVNYNYDDNAIQTFDVTFSFRNWFNYFLDRSGNIELGQPNFRPNQVKSGLGAFGGLLNNLPPELRRVGTDILQQAQRSLPIGKITGGNVSPPFGNFSIGPFNL